MMRGKIDEHVHMITLHHLFLLPPAVNRESYFYRAMAQYVKTDRNGLVKQLFDSKHTKGITADAIIRELRNDFSIPVMDEGATWT